MCQSIKIGKKGVFCPFGKINIFNILFKEIPVCSDVNDELAFSYILAEV